MALELCTFSINEALRVKELKLHICICLHHTCETLLAVASAAWFTRISTFSRGFVSVRRKEARLGSRMKRIHGIERREQGRVSPRDTNSSLQIPIQESENIYKNKALVPEA